MQVIQTISTVQEFLYRGLLIFFYKLA